MIKILAIGDVVGKPGRRSLHELMPAVREQYKPDFTIINGENSAGGFGINQKVFNELSEKFHGDCITTGNHWHDKQEVRSLVGQEKRLLLPANMHNVKDERHGLGIYPCQTGVRIAVINLHGQAFMSGSNSSPFEMYDQLEKLIPQDVKIRVVDFHAEATSEKQALGHYLDGRASLVYGTHTHCPTADTRTLPNGTGFQTDLGMTGPYDSVIGICKKASLARFLGQERKPFQPAKKDLRLFGVVATIDEITGLCIAMERVEAAVDK